MYGSNGVATGGVAATGVAGALPDTGGSVPFWALFTEHPMMALSMALSTTMGMIFLICAVFALIAVAFAIIRILPRKEG